MISKEEGQKIAMVVIGQLAQKSGLDFVIIEKSVIERPFAWVFPFNTRAYAETGDFRQAALGSGPVVVNRQSGVAILAPSMPIAIFLEQYEAELKENK